MQYILLQYLWICVDVSRVDGILPSFPHSPRMLATGQHGHDPPPPLGHHQMLVVCVRDRDSDWFVTGLHVCAVL